MKKNNKKKTQQELKALHSNDYVVKFESEQKESRVLRLIQVIKFTKKDDVIDIGCGSGMIIPLIIDDINSYTGLDFSKDFIDFAELKHTHKYNQVVDFICDDINHFSINTNQRFSKALALDLSEHVYDEEWLRMLKSMYTLLKNDGCLYIHTPNLDFFIEKLKNKNLILKQFPEHIAVRNAQENVNILISAGFKNIEVLYLPHYNLLRHFHIFSYIPIIGKYFKARIFIKAKK